MTAKDYVKIAEAIRNARERNADTEEQDFGDQWYRDDGIDMVVEALMPILSADNPRFDQAKFLSACK